MPTIDGDHVTEEERIGSDESPEPNRWRSVAIRYGVAIAAIAVSLIIAAVLRNYSIELNLTILIVAALLIPTWYGGKGPGFLVAITFELVTLIMRPPPPDGSLGQYILGHISVMSFYVLFVLLIGARRNGEKKNREQPEWLKATLSSIDDGVIATDTNGLITLLNPIAEDLTGWPAKEAVGERLSKVFVILDETTRHQDEDLVARVLRNGIKKGALFNPSILVSKAGNEFTINSRIVPIKAADGKIAGMVLVFSDTSERIRTTEARRAIEGRYRTLFDHAPDGIVIADPNSYYLDANASMCRMLGYTHEEFVELHASDIVAPDELPHIDQALSAIKSQSEYQREWQFLRKDRSRFTGEVIAMEMPDGNLLAVIRDISERERAEAAVRESQSRLAGIIDSVMDAIITVDNEQIILVFNRAAERMFDCPAAEAIGQSLDRFVPARFRDAHSSHIRRFGEAGISPRAMAETRSVYGLRRNGEEFSLEASISQVEAGGQKLYAVIMRDISEHKRAEERLRQIIEHAPYGKLLVDEDGKIELVNAEIEKIFGYSREELLGQMIKMLVPDRFHKHCAEYRKGFTAAPSARAIGSGRDLFGLRKDGTEFPVEIGLNPLKTEEGIMVLGTIVDITQRKQAEEALRRSQEQLAGIINSAMDAIITVDDDQRIVVFNSAAEKMFRYPAEEAMGKPLDRFIPERFRPTHKNHIRDFGKTNVTRRSMASLGAIFGQRSDGEEFPIEASISQLESDGQKFYTVILRDITERKAAEMQNRKLHETLEKRVIERTTELEAVNKELEAFSYSVSHDLRAPLRHINGFSQAVLEDYADVLDDTGKSHLQEVRSASLRMAQLIDDVLRLARVSRSEMHREKIDLSKLAADILAELQRREPERSVKVSIEDELVACGDKRLLGIVLTNLLENAWKFTSKKKGAEIVVGLEDADGRAAGFFVRDNGAGFDMAYADKLYGAFQRLHNTNEFEGTGIGLATVQRIIHRHGGSVWAEGKVNEGATFYFTLPEFKESENEG